MKQKIWPLDNLIDVRPLEDLHFKICLGIAKSKLTPNIRVIPHYEAKRRFREAVDYKSVEQSRIFAVADDGLEHLSDKEVESYEKLSYVERRKFLQLYCNGYYDGDFVRVRFTKKEFLKDKFATFYADKTEESLNYGHFTELMTWIKTLPFQEIGRILFFVTNAHMAADMHYDRKDDWYDGRHHFIWFNPFNQKKFFLVDGYQKEYVKDKAIFFDTSYLHGSDESDQTTYTLRIDGQLTEEFCAKAGIKWKKR